MGAAAESFPEVTGECADICAFRASHTYNSARQSQSRVIGHVDSARRIAFGSGDRWRRRATPGQGVSECRRHGSGVFGSDARSESNASSRINVTDNSELGLPRAVVRMACSKGTYVRAFARDLGEALGSGAHLDSLQRSRSGTFRVENALTVEQAINLLQA